MATLGQSRRFVDGITDDGVLESLSRTDVPGYGNTCGDADSRAHFRNLGTQALLNLAGSGECAAGVIVECRRRSEDRQRCVALELVDESAVCVDLVDDDVEETV